MPADHYTIRAIWDAEAGVYHSETDVPGLIVETATLAEFIDVAQSLAAELLVMNGDPVMPLRFSGEVDLALAA